MPTSSSNERSDASARRALLAMLLATLILVLAVLRPLRDALLLAAVLAMVLSPLHQWLTRRLWGHSAPAAGALVVLVIAIVVGPLVWLSAFVVAEAADAVQFVSKTVRSEGTRGLIEKLPDGVERQVNSVLEQLGADFDEILKSIQQQMTNARGSAAAAVGAAVSATGSLLFQGTMMVIALFFLLSNSESVINWLDETSPLRRGQTRELFNEFVRVCKSVVVSSVATALLQALTALLGYFITGMPNPLFFFALTFIGAFIPAVGASLVCLVAAGILFVTGHPWAALFLAIHALLVVGLVDNVAKPWFMKDGIRLHGAVIFFALVGGLAAFGPMGLLMGPLAVALFLAILRMYKRDYSADPADRQAMQQQNAGPTQHLEPPTETSSNSPDEPLQA
jgi:predicted PurR-regulated permease PerM